MLVLMAGGGRKVFRIMSLSLHLKLGYAVRTLSSEEPVIASVHNTRDMQWNSADDNWGFLLGNRIYGRKIEDGRKLEGNWTNLNNCDLHLSSLKKISLSDYRLAAAIQLFEIIGTAKCWASLGRARNFRWAFARYLLIIKCSMLLMAFAECFPATSRL